MAKLSTNDIYKKVTDNLIEAMERGDIPWRKTWSGVGNDCMPTNLRGTKYRGINILTLSWAGFSSPTWATYKQISEAGGTVKKGSKSTPVVFWKIIKGKDKATGEATAFPLLRYYNVFNLDQTEGIEDPNVQPEGEPRAFNPIDAAQKIVEGYSGCPEIESGKAGAWYRPSADLIGMPCPESFENGEEYYSTLFHEMGHSTGHRKRLNREGVTNPISFGSHTYAAEELVAEFCAAYLCGEAGVSTQPTIENSGAYLRGWLKRVKDEPGILVKAAAAGQKAADHILGRKWDNS